MEGPLFSGALFRHIMEELEKAVGHDTVWNVVGELTDEQRTECLDVLAIRWVHANTSVCLARAVARRTGRKDRELHDLVVAKATERVFTTIWRVIFNYVSVEAMVTRVPIIFNRTYRGIQATATLDAPGHGTIRIKGWPNMDELSLHGIAVSTNVALKITAQHGVAITSERLADGARYILQWK